MNNIILITLISFQLLCIPVLAQMPPKEVVGSSGKPDFGTRLPPEMADGKRFEVPGEIESSYAYKKRIAQLEALITKQREVINALQSELQQLKEVKNGKKP